MSLSGTHFLQGNIACAEGALAAGCRFFAGYPITPSTEIAEWLAKRLPEEGGVYIQMEDEIASLGAVIGASWAGKKAMTATSGPGFSLMQEHVGYAAMTETPCLIVDVQRGSPSTGQPTLPAQGDVMQARWGSHGDYEIVAYAPNSVQEMFTLTVELFNLAERLRVPVILLADEVIAHMREKVQLPESVEVEERKVPGNGEAWPDEALVPPMPVFGRGYRAPVTGLTHDSRGYPTTDDPEAHARLVSRLSRKVLENREEIARVEEVHTEDAEITIVSYGAPSRSAYQAVLDLREERIRAGYLRLIGLWPFPEEAVARAAERSRLLVVEMNLGQIAREVERVTHSRPLLLSRMGGELPSPGEIRESVVRAL
jgi:2-oxoglutarate ferredoxin oxidoreductase subunit alpha